MQMARALSWVARAAISPYCELGYGDALLSGRMRLRAVDTNALVRLITRDDPRQTASAERFIHKGAWVSPLALAEAMCVLDSVYELSSKNQARAVEMLLNHRDLVLHDREAVAAALELFRERPALGFSDCLMLEFARKAGHLPLGTFDRSLAKVEGIQKL